MKKILAFYSCPLLSCLILMPLRATTKSGAADRSVRPTTTKSGAADRSVRPTPEPGIILRLRRQAPAYRVLADVLQLLLQASIAAQGMVERLLLPDRTRHSQYLIHAASRDAFN